MNYGTPISISGIAPESFGDGRTFACGETDQLSFGILELPAGMTAGYDAGHKNADEIFFAVCGEALINYPTQDKLVHLAENEFTLIFRDLPHVVSNPGTKTLKLLYATCAQRD